MFIWTWALITEACLEARFLVSSNWWCYFAMPTLHFAGRIISKASNGFTDWLLASRKQSKVVSNYGSLKKADSLNKKDDWGALHINPIFCNNSTYLQDDTTGSMRMHCISATLTSYQTNNIYMKISTSRLLQTLRSTKWTEYRDERRRGNSLQATLMIR